MDWALDNIAPNANPADRGLLAAASFLQRADNFGAGRHPQAGYLDVKDLSFKFEIIAE